MSKFEEWSIGKPREHWMRNYNWLRHKGKNKCSDGDRACVKIDNDWVCSICYAVAPKEIAYIVDLCKCSSFKTWSDYDKFKKGYYERQEKNRKD